MRITGIYRFFVKETNETLYVGSSRHIRDRWYKSHYRDPDFSNFLKENKYSREIIHECNPKFSDTEIRKIEQLYIDICKPRFNKINACREEETYKEYKDNYNFRNREKTSIYCKKRYEIKKDEINNDRRIKIPCKNCKKNISKRNMSRHIINIH